MSSGEKQRREKPSILLVANGKSVTATRRWVLQHAGYGVRLARTTAAAIAGLTSERRIDVLLLGSIIGGIDIPLVIRAARKRRPKIFIVSATRQSNAGVDFQVEPLAGPEALLRVVGEAVVTAHGHKFSKRTRAMFVDRDRRYIHVTDGAAELVGYTREELLGCRIDDISAPEMDVPRKFRSYIRNGSQHGVFSLRHRDGHILRVRYAATVLADGCMVSRLRKLADDTGAISDLA